MRIAVIGSGAAGLGAAWSLSHEHEVILYEAASKLGGHANTVDVAGPEGPVAVDTGFIVYNEHNYPNLTALFAHLGIETEASDMSFAVSLAEGSYEYEGSALGFFGQKRNLLRPSQWKLLVDIRRFFREAPAILLQKSDGQTLGDYLKSNGYSDSFAYDHLLPMAAAIWSSPVEEILAFPARSFVSFYANHGLLRFADRPQWRSVKGGSRTYVEKISASFRKGIRLATPVVGVERLNPGVEVIDARGQRDRFDAVVMASHADQSLAILGDSASPLERKVLGAFRYQENKAILHSDESLMPRRRRLWASWNYLSPRRRDQGEALAVTYWMNRLQNLSPSLPLFVTLNSFREPQESLVHERFTYDHPQFDEAAIAAQALLPEIQGAEGIWYCGSYCGFGFHEDALQSGLAVAERFGLFAPWAEEIKPMSPAWRAVRAADGSLAEAAE
jgi:predicted NAD/FAD-binding protein